MDFLSFALDCVAAETGIDRAALRPLERKIRHQQGGDRHYIGSNLALDSSDRRQAIVRSLGAGQTAAQVAERLGITRQAVSLARKKHADESATQHQAAKANSNHSHPTKGP